MGVIQLNEIKDLLSKALKANKEIVKGNQFSVEAQFKGKSRDDEDFIKLYANGSVIAVYEANEKDLNIINWDYKKEVKYFGDCLEEEGMEVYVDEGLMD
jgi:tRNA(Ser,Leu) C12 N-acetylase TAN1